MRESFFDRASDDLERGQYRRLKKRSSTLFSRADSLRPLRAFEVLGMLLVRRRCASVGEKFQYQWYFKGEQKKRSKSSKVHRNVVRSLYVWKMWCNNGEKHENAAAKSNTRVHTHSCAEENLRKCSHRGKRFKDQSSTTFNLNLFRFFTHVSTVLVAHYALGLKFNERIRDESFTHTVASLKRIFPVFIEWKVA